MKKLFEVAIDECVWRQPSILFIDDLDTICREPNGPEEETSVESLFSLKIAEGQCSLVHLFVFYY